MRAPSLAMAGLALVGSCTTEPPYGDALPQAQVEHRQDLDAPRLLRRMSLDLRGVLPSVDELDAVEADPALVADLRDTWLDDPLLEERLVHLLAERWHTRTDAFDIEHYDYGFEDHEAYAWYRSVGEEPLRLMARVVVEDRSWTEVVTADTTVANELLGAHWPLDYPEGETGWQEVAYTDGRPAAGVLATNGLWWRYSTSAFNQNRGRAAAMTRLLICEDVLSRPVSFADAPNLLSDEGTAEAIATEPACVSCHATLEPIAATLYGFFPLEQYNVAEVDTYHPERELQGEADLGVTRAWYGTPVDGLGELGQVIAEDPRFARCAAESFAAALWRREVALDEQAHIDALRDELVLADGRIKPLLRAITQTPAYRAGSLSDDAPADLLDRERTIRLLPPDVLRSSLEALTGFRWTTGDVPLLDEDSDGVRILAGGVDGEEVQTPQEEPGLTWALVGAELAEGAAAHAVETELVAEEPGVQLFAGLTLDDRPGDTPFDGTLEQLIWQTTATRPDAQRLDELHQLWLAMEADAGAAEAWTALLTLLLRDPEMVTT